MKEIINQNNKTLFTLSREKLIDKILEMDEKFHQLELIIGKKDAIIDKLNEQLKKQKEQLNRNSCNSSKPPSTDGFKKSPKPKSERVKSEKEAGGQPGHVGVTLKPVKIPDNIKKYDDVFECVKCKQDLSKINANVIKRQEIDIPSVKPIVTEHRVSTKVCPKCKTTNIAGPKSLTQSIQYGQRVKALATYLHYDQLIPLQRSQEIFSDLFELSISEGTLVNMHNEIYVELEQSQKDIKEYLEKSEAINFDETSLRVNNKTNWLHSASNSNATAYFIHQKRGTQAMDAMDILPKYTGIAVHDHWKPYLTYTLPQHSLCNAHHIRELRGIYENYSQDWALRMRELLCKINDAVCNSKSAGNTKLSQEQLNEFSAEYDLILESAKKELPIITSSAKKRGKAKQHPAKNLHDRLVNFKKEALLFMYNFKAPFTNNQAEQDVRMMKLKQKISGCFRSKEGADRFCRIRSYISTTKKQNINNLDALVGAAQGQPIELFKQNLGP